MLVTVKGVRIRVSLTSTGSGESFLTTARSTSGSPTVQSEKAMMLLRVTVGLAVVVPGMVADAELDERTQSQSVAAEPEPSYRQSWATAWSVPLLGRLKSKGTVRLAM